MLMMYKKDNLLYVKVMMDLKLDIAYQGVMFGKGKKEKLLLPEEVMCILKHNGNLKIFDGKKFIKLNLGQFYDLYINQKFVIEEIIEKPKPVEQPKVEVKKEQPKPEVKKEEVVKPVEQPKVEVKKEEPKPEVKKEEPKVEVKKEEVVKPVEQPKPEVKKEEVVKPVEQPKVDEKKVEQQPKKQDHNDNKKQRHNNNNKQQNQGGDK